MVRSESLETRLRSALSQHRTVLVTLGVALVVFLAYNFLGPPETVYNNFVLLGDAFLHGRVEIADGVDPSHIEYAINDGKLYIIPPPWPAIILLPGTLIFGLDLNQTLASAVLGAVAAAIAFSVVRSMTERLSTQIWLTALFFFGTVYFYAASDGSVWFFSHTVAVLFLFAAIYFTIVRKNPLLAGLCLGAAFWTRQPTILTLPFFLIMFSEQWLRPPAAGSLIDRIDPKPLVQLGTGLGIFVLASFAYNYARFDTPLDASQHHLPERVQSQPWFNHGPFDPRYVSRHVTVFFESMPIVQSQAPYVLPSWGGMAVWASTPAFFYALFNHVRDRRLIIIGVGMIAVTTTIIISRAIASYWDVGWATYTFPLHINIAPFYLLIAAAIFVGRRDKLVLACWGAILPTTLMLFTFAGTGFSQFGYRFALDFMPFLFLLTIKAMGNDLKWHHKTLIVASILINLWGVVWIHQFSHDNIFGLDGLFDFLGIEGIFDLDGFLDREWVRF